LAVGYGLTDLIAVEASYFQIQEARYPLPPPPGPTTIPAPAAAYRLMSARKSPMLV
jgi:hypothetical protein